MEQFDFSQLSEDTVGLDVTQVLEAQKNSPENGGTDTSNKDVKKEVKEELSPLDILNESKTEKQVTDNETEDVIGDNKTKTPPQISKPKGEDLPFSLVFKSLNEEGILSTFDEEAYKKDVEEGGTAQAILNATNRHIEEVTKQRIAELDEDAKEYSTLKDLGVNPQVAQNLIATKIEFEKITPEQLEAEDAVELRKEIITRNLLNTTNWSEAKIKKQVELTIDSGKDVEEAKESLIGVNQFNKDQIELTKQNKIKEDQAKQTQRETLTKQYKEYIEKLDEPIPGVKVNKQTKAKIEQLVLSGGIWETRKVDPVKFDTMVAYFINGGGLDGKFDKPTVKAKSAAITELEKAIGTSKKTTDGIVIQDIGVDDGAGSAILKNLNVKR